MNLRALSQSRILVLGAGTSGRSAARFLLARGGRVTLADDQPRDRLPPEVDELEAQGVEVTGGGFGPASEKPVDLCVVSPGIPFEDPRLEALRARGVPVVGEIELAAAFIDAPVIAITGTNGKTTVTRLTGQLLEAAGKKVFVGGNVGTPLIEAANGPKDGGAWDAVVAEVSSFQLETCYAFKPAVSVWLNLTGNHLDRHGDLERYAAAKARIFQNQTPTEAAVVNREDPYVWRHATRSHATLLPFSTERTLGVGAWLEGEEVVVLLPGTDGVRLPASLPGLPGRHNLGNAMAACLAVSALGLDPAAAWEETRHFRGLPHRIQHFLDWRGIRFVDDSKATSVDAAARAVETVGGPLVWLAGGIEKGAEYTPLRPVLSSHARLIVLVGPHVERMNRELEGAAPIRRAADWTEGVRIAVEAARSGDAVLLSPAAASFDFFKSYSERGDTFQRLCREETERIERAGG
jgi:UDP-N-acetylmuramoylalanine--D-glutamate ligase